MRCTHKNTIIPTLIPSGRTPEKHFCMDCKKYIKVEE